MENFVSQQRIMAHLEYAGRLGRLRQFRKPRCILHHGACVYVSAYGADAIFRLDAATHERLSAIRTPDLVNPRGLVVVGKKLFAACYGHPVGSVVVICLDTLSQAGTFKVHRPRGITASGGLLYVTEVFMDRIGVFSLDGNLKCHIYCRLHRPRGIAIDKERSLLVVADSGNDRLVWMTLDGRIVKKCPGLHAPNDVVICPDGTIVASEWYGRSLRMLRDGKLSKRFVVPGGSGHFSMMGRSRRRVYVSDDDRGCVHVFVRRGVI